MLKRALNRAIKLYDGTPGIEMVDNYFASLYKEEITELSQFLDYSIKDIRKVYKNNRNKEYMDILTKKYVGQLSETHQCLLEFTLSNEGGDTMYDPCVTDIVIRFRSFQKSTWVDQFVISGKGFNGGISIKELDDWEILIDFISDKKYDSAKLTPTSADILSEKIDNIVMIDLNDK